LALSVIAYWLRPICDQSGPDSLCLYDWLKVWESALRGGLISTWGSVALSYGRRGSRGELVHDSGEFTLDSGELREAGASPR